MHVLDALRLSETLQDAQAFVCSPAALRTVLHRAPEVAAVRNAFEAGSLTEQQVEQFVREAMSEARADELHPADVALAALAVALEPYMIDLAEKYLSGLSALCLAELPMSIRVAQLCVRHRESYARDHERARTLANPVPGTITIATLDEDEPREYDIEYDSSELKYAAP